MNVLLASCGSETDAIEVLPKCLNDLLKCGIAKENIFVYDLHDEANDERILIYRTLKYF